MLEWIFDKSARSCLKIFNFGCGGCKSLNYVYRVVSHPPKVWYLSNSSVMCMVILCFT